MNKVLYPPFSTGASARYAYDSLLESRLTFESKYGDKVCLTRRAGNILLVPRGLAPSLGEDLRTTAAVSAISCRHIPRDADQLRCLDQSVELLRAGRDHVLEAPTGWGKSIIGAAIAAELGQKTIIVVSKQDLVQQWRDALYKLGFTPDQIGIAQADELEYEGKRFVIAMIQSLIRPNKYDSKFLGSFGLAIFDETHRVAADVFSNAAFLLPAKYRLGLSATPKRPDGKTPVIEAHIGPVLVSGTVVPMKPKILVKKTKWKIPQWMTKIEPGRLQPVFKAMSHSEQRNQHIVSFVVSAYKADRTVVVMGDTIAYLKWLQTLCGVAGIPGEDMGQYIGEIAGNKELLKLNANKRVIFATYQMAQEGTDYPQWDSLVMVTPRSNVKQPLGRILRSKPGKKTPVCLDLVDDGNIFDAFRWKRFKTYHEVGAQIVELP